MGREYTLSALIVDPDASRRSRLNSAVSNLPKVSKIIQSKSSDDALEKTAEVGYADVVFVSNKVDRSEFRAMQSELKRTGFDKGSAYIVVMEASKLSQEVIEAQLALGFHGAVGDPFSVEQLSNIIELARQVKEDYRRAKLDRSVKSLLNELITQCRVASKLVQLGHTSSGELERFRRLAEKLDNLNDEELDRYFELLADAFAKEPPPPDLPADLMYSGASKRVRERLEAKLVAFIAAPPSSTPSRE